MSWQRKKPGHQQPWHWLFWTRIVRSPHKGSKFMVSAWPDRARWWYHVVLLFLQKSEGRGFQWRGPLRGGFHTEQLHRNSVPLVVGIEGIFVVTVFFVVNSYVLVVSVHVWMELAHFGNENCLSLFISLKTKGEWGSGDFLRTHIHTDHTFCCVTIRTILLLSFVVVGGLWGIVTFLHKKRAP